MKLFLSPLFLSILFIPVYGQQKINPVFKDSGFIWDVPFAIDKPDPSLHYKIVVEAGSAPENPAELYEPLDHIARMYNLHVYGGVPKENLEVAVVLFSSSIDIILKNEAYKKKYGVDNPNIKILEELKNAGIKILACGQSMMKNEINPKEVNPHVIPGISRFTTVSTLQMMGYAFFKF